MARKIKLDELSREISDALYRYTDDVSNGIGSLGQELSQEAVKKLKETSPKRKGKSGGKYAKGWTVSVIKGKRVIHNAKHYRLTHLLEYGHTTVDGNRTSSKPHIRPVAEQLVKKYIEGVEKIVKNGTK